MDESWKHHAKWKKLIIKHHIVYDSIYKKHSEQENLSTKQSGICPRLGDWESVITKE